MDEEGGAVGILFAVIVLVFLVICVLRVISEREKLSSAPRILLFEKAPPLFSPAERSFYGVLEQAIGDDYRIFAKVRLGDVIQPKKGLEKSSYYAARNMIDRKHLDYVICGKTDFVPVGAIELDDKSHQRQDRKERDDLVDRALDDAGIPILHFSVRTTYSVQDVRLNIANAFSLSLTGVKEAVPAGQAPQMGVRREADPKEFRFSSEEEGVEPSVPPIAEASKAQSAVEVCPDCGAKMVVRKVSKGPHVGRHFWACTKYPRCRSVKPVSTELSAQMDF